jgi:hypothetical protein
VLLARRQIVRQERQREGTCRPPIASPAKLQPHSRTPVFPPFYSSLHLPLAGSRTFLPRSTCSAAAAATPKTEDGDPGHAAASPVRAPPRPRSPTPCPPLPSYGSLRRAVSSLLVLQTVTAGRRRPGSSRPRTTATSAKSRVRPAPNQSPHPSLSLSLRRPVPGCLIDLGA